ncbi:hypothetical protein JCM15519_06400 [Fundidesulfovibrio butyratiphilus]
MNLFTHSIRIGLAAIVLLATLPAMAIIAFTGYEFEQHAREDCLDQAKKLTSSLASMQQGITQEARSLLMTLASLPMVQNRRQAECDALFTSLMEHHPELTNIFLTDEKGVAIASALAPFRGFRLDNRKYFQAAMRTNAFSVGEFIIGRTSHKPVVVFSYPVRDKNGNAVGVLGMSLLLEKYQAFLNKYSLPPKAQVSIFDHAGMRMFTYPRSDFFQLGGRLREEVLTGVIQSTEDEGLFYEKRLIGGNDGLFTFSRLRLDKDSPPYMTILVVFSMDQTFARGHRLMLRNLSLTALAGLAALAVALLFGERSVLRGLNNLMAVADRLGRLDLSARAKTGEGSLEVRRLGESFNAMAQALDHERKALKESTRSLIRTRGVLANILESMPSAIIGLDAKGWVTHWNENAAKLSGTPTRAALGKPLSESFAWLAPLVDTTRLPGRHDQPLVMEKRPFGQGTDERFVDVLAYPLVCNGEEGVVVRVDDVTTRVRMEELLIRNEKMSTVGSLAGGMAHEINNPLSGILQSLQIIMRRLSPDLPANVRTATDLGCDLAAMRAYLEARGILGFLESMRESGERATKIVRNMLGFIRKSASAKTPQNLPELLDCVVDIASSDYDLKKKYDFRQIEIVREYAPDTPDVPCSAAEIEQVVFNLLYNAAQAMASQPTPHAPPRLILRVHSQGEHCVFEVEDNGPGMEESVRQRIFEPLFSTKAPGEGTGLGLALAYFIVVNTHGGTIEAVTAPGQGTRFVIRLPYAATTEISPAQKA